MATVTINCPVNGAEVATDVEPDEESYGASTVEDKQIKSSSGHQWLQGAKKYTFPR